MRRLQSLLYRPLCQVFLVLLAAATITTTFNLLVVESFSSMRFLRHHHVSSQSALLRRCCSSSSSSLRTRGVVAYPASSAALLRPHHYHHLPSFSLDGAGARLRRQQHTQLFSSFSTVPQTSDETLQDDHDEEPQQQQQQQFNTERFANQLQTMDPPSTHLTDDTLAAAATDNLEEYFQQRGIKSRPTPDGKWNVKDPVGWTKKFGRPAPEDFEILCQQACLKPGDEGYFDVSDIKVPGVTIVRTKEEAKIVLAKLQAAEPGIFHACDTEVMCIDLTSEGPVGNGYVTCVSMFSGFDFDYGLGDGPGTCLWIDNLDEAFGTLEVFKPWFEDENHLKVWHNYGFDRHVMWNHGIDVRGFGGDTMHMARLEDTSRGSITRLKTDGGKNGYSLEALTESLLKVRKKPMKEIFGVKRLRKDGTEGSLVDIPPVEVMQRDPAHRIPWIQYSSYDAKGTYMLREKLAERLTKKSWFQGRNLLDYYMMHMRPFGEVLTDMERRGIRVDARDYLAKVEEQAREDRAYHLKVFREWAAKQIGPDGWALNPASSVQLQTFLFGGSQNKKTQEYTEQVRFFKIPRDELPAEALEAYRLQEGEASKSGKKGEPDK